MQFRPKAVHMPVMTKHLLMCVSHFVNHLIHSHIHGLEPGRDLLPFGVTDGQDGKQEDRRSNDLVSKGAADRQEFTGIRGEDLSSR